VRADPVRQTLAPGGLGVGVVRGSQDRYEDGCLVHLTAVAVDHGDALPSIIDKELLTRAVSLRHDEIELVRPGAGGLAKPTILQTFWRGRLLFPPHHD